MGTKTCRRCGVDKNTEDMKMDKRNKDGFSSFCKECHKQASVRWQKENPAKLNAMRKSWRDRNNERINLERRGKYNSEVAWWSALKQRYRVTREWYTETFQKQGGCCAVCKAHQSNLSRRLSVDHDHACCRTTPTCGLCNRGLLCGTCNTSIHALDSKVGWLESAVAYLEENRK